MNRKVQMFGIKNIGFTLAETLIVMGIIGIVAALTIPNLNSSTNNQEKVTKVKKIYAELNEAQNRAMAVYGPVSDWFVQDGDCTTDDTACKKRYFDRVTEFMKVQKTCIESENGCMDSGSIKNLDGSDWVPATLPQAVLSNGASFSIFSLSHPGCDASMSGHKDFCGDIYVDIDGPNKGKNTYGIDIFAFASTAKGVSPLCTAEELSLSITGCTYWGWACAAWVIEKGNMDYLLTSKESATDSLTCPNNTTLTWERGSCK